MKCRYCGEDRWAGLYDVPGVGPMHGDCLVEYYKTAAAERDEAQARAIEYEKKWQEAKLEFERHQFETTSEHCRRTGQQNCHFCNDINCGDNTSEFKQKIREQHNVIEGYGRALQSAAWQVTMYSHHLYALQDAVKAYQMAEEACHRCPEILLSCPTSDEPARLMSEMYKARDKMFALANQVGGWEGCEEAGLTERDRVVWRSALTFANNLCVQISDRANRDDGPTDIIYTAAQCAKRIREFLEMEEGLEKDVLDAINASLIERAKP